MEITFKIKKLFVLEVYGDYYRY